MLHIAPSTPIVSPHISGAALPVMAGDTSSFAIALNGLMPSAKAGSPQSDAPQGSVPAATLDLALRQKLAEDGKELPLLGGIVADALTPETEKAFDTIELHAPVVELPSAELAVPLPDTKIVARAETPAEALPEQLASAPSVGLSIAIEARTDHVPTVSNARAVNTTATSGEPVAVRTAVGAVDEALVAPVTETRDASSARATLHTVPSEARALRPDPGPSAPMDYRVTTQAGTTPMIQAGANAPIKQALDMAPSRVPESVIPVATGPSAKEALSPVVTSVATATPPVGTPREIIAQILKPGAPVITIAQQAGVAAPPITLGAHLRQAAERPEIAMMALHATAVQTPQAVQMAPNVAQGALDLRRQEWIGDMIDHIENLRDASPMKETRIRLMPDALGRVDIAVRQEGERVHVQFTTETQTARQILSDAQPKLQEMAAERGVRLGQTSVDSGHANSGQNNSETHQGQRQQHAHAVPARSASAGENTQSATPQSDDRIA